MQITYSLITYINKNFSSSLEKKCRCVVSASTVKKTLLLPENNARGLITNIESTNRHCVTVHYNGQEQKTLT